MRLLLDDFILAYFLNSVMNFSRLSFIVLSLRVSDLAIFGYLFFCVMASQSFLSGEEGRGVGRSMLAFSIMHFFQDGIHHVSLRCFRKLTKRGSL